MLTRLRILALAGALLTPLLAVQPAPATSDEPSGTTTGACRWIFAAVTPDQSLAYAEIYTQAKDGEKPEPGLLHENAPLLFGPPDDPPGDEAIQYDEASGIYTCKDSDHVDPGTVRYEVLIVTWDERVPKKQAETIPRLPGSEPLFSGRTTELTRLDAPEYDEVGIHRRWYARFDLEQFSDIKGGYCFSARSLKENGELIDKVPTNKARECIPTPPPDSVPGGLNFSI